MFQTETLNGSLIYVLWPYTPRTGPDGHPLVGFAHGTSGGFPNCAPSHVRNLWYQFIAPYVLALQGYVVVAPDYAGLGVSRDSAGRQIRHPYTAHPAHANDLFYSVQAAQTAFATVSKRFVLMGHPQGGGAVWGAAQRAPVINVHDLIQLGGAADGAVGMLIANALPDILPSFDPGTFLTPAGLKLFPLISGIQGCQSVVAEPFLDPSLYKPDWYDTDDAKRFFDLTTNGGKRIGGPMLVLQGEADPEILPPITNEAVNRTCASFPDSQLQYHTYAGVTHVPIMYASQVTWLDWIADRFDGKPVPVGCNTSTFASVRPYEEYQDNPNWFLEYATDAYEVA